MKATKIILGLLLSLVNVFGSAELVLLSGSPQVIAPSYLISDNLEYANSSDANTIGGWTTTSTPTWAYATAPAPLEGTRSIRFTASAQNTFIEFPSQTDLWVYFLANAASNAANSLHVLLRDSTPTTMASADFISTGIVRVNAGGLDNSSSAGTFLGATTYHCWLHYSTNGSTANMDFYISTTGVRPGSPQASKVSGSSTGGVTRLHLASASTTTVIFDKIRVSTSAIGDNPL